MNISEKFAESLVSLGLSRRGYKTYASVPPGMGEEADILAVGQGEKFAVQVKVLKSRHLIPKQLECERLKYKEAFGTPTYFAFLVDDETLLLVDAALRQRMQFRDNQVSLEDLPFTKTIDTELKY